MNFGDGGGEGDSGLVYTMLRESKQSGNVVGGVELHCHWILTRVAVNTTEVEPIVDECNGFSFVLLEQVRGADEAHSKSWYVNCWKEQGAQGSSVIMN
ncbi:hypothetical protein ACA910_019142 [Epithemia clementina (nom. ined.)]